MYIENVNQSAIYNLKWPKATKFVILNLGEVL
jgi:hypothetical protein